MQQLKDSRNIGLSWKNSLYHKNQFNFRVKIVKDSSSGTPAMIKYFNLIISSKVFLQYYWSKSVIKLVTSQVITYGLGYLHSIKGIGMLSLRNRWFFHQVTYDRSKLEFWYWFVRSAPETIKQAAEPSYEGRSAVGKCFQKSHFHCLSITQFFAHSRSVK